MRKTIVGTVFTEDRFTDLDAQIEDLLVRLRKIQSPERELTRHLRSARGRRPAGDVTVVSHLRIAVTDLLDQVENTKESEKVLIDRLEALRRIQEELIIEDRNHRPQHPEVFLG